MNKLIDRLQNKTILISDGATGTNLQQRGLLKGKAPETGEWGVEIMFRTGFVEGGTGV